MTTTAVAAAATLLKEAEAVEENLPVIEEREKHFLNATRRQDVTSSASQWHVLGRRVPRSEIVFACQMLLVYIVVCTSIFNLSTGRGDSNLWTALLSSCLGYILPNPKLGKKQST